MDDCSTFVHFAKASLAYFLDQMDPFRLDDDERLQGGGVFGRRIRRPVIGISCEAILQNDRFCQRHGHHRNVGFVVDHVVVVMRAAEAPPASVKGEQTDEHDKPEDQSRYKPSHSGGMLAIFFHGRLGLEDEWVRHEWPVG